MPWRDAPTIGNLLGTRMVLNEFVAYSQLGPMKATLDPQVVHDRDLRAVRLRQLQLDRHPDRRHRRAGAEPPARSGAARPARDVRRHAGELHDRDDRRVPAVTRSTYARAEAGAQREFLARPRIGAACPTSRSCSAPASAISPTRSATPTSIAVRRDPALAGVGGHRPRREAGRRHARAAQRVAALVGPRHFYEGHDSRTVDVRDARRSACSASGR